MKKRTSTKLFAAIRRLVQRAIACFLPRINLTRKRTRNCHSPIARHWLPPQIVSPTSCLLVDLENFCINPQIESILNQHSQYPLTTKIAFANFCNHPKKSLELHKNGYQLIHVPQLKNAADAQMLLTGSLLFIQFPQVQEVFICSNDRILTFLKNTLTNLGKNVYLVNRNGNHLLLNRQVIDMPELDKPHSKLLISTREELDNLLVALVADLCSHHNTSRIKLSSLGIQFTKIYGQSLSSALTKLNLGIKPLTFFKKNPRFQIIRHNQDYFVSVPSLENESLAL